MDKSSLKTLVAKRWLVALVSVAAVWLLATLVTVIWLLVNKTAIPVAKYAYVIALPVTFVLLLIFSCLWSKLWVRCAMASLLMWSLCLLAFVFLNLTVANAWLVFLIGGAAQLLIVLWYLLRLFVLKDKQSKSLKPDEQQEEQN